MGQQARLEYLRAIYPRYRVALRGEKGRMLDEFCRVTGYHRKYALRLLNSPAPGSEPVRPRRRRRPKYAAELITALVVIWKAAGYPWSARLKALLPQWLPWARKRLKLTAELERHLLAISARQIDRRLKDHKRDLKKHLYGRTKPGTLLKHHIPLRTERWETTQPGFTEVDLVSHSGNCADGEFIHSLNLTDIHTTWGESRAVMGKAQVRVQLALEDIRSSLPFTLRGIDSDNGSEFINEHLLRYCGGLGIEFTRGRPYKKDDNAHVEQKNWTHVRKLLGYVRYDSQQALAAINHLYRNELRLLQNLFLPSVKLVRKERVGSRTRRVYDQPQTPFERLKKCGHADARKVEELDRLRRRLDPFELSQAIDRQLEQIYQLAGDGRSQPSKLPAATHPWRQSYKTMRPAASAGR